MKYFLLILFIGFTSVVVAQNTIMVGLSFKPFFKNAPLVIDDAESEQGIPEIGIETFKCYISNIRFYDQEELVFTKSNSYHLLDAENEASLKINFSIPQYLSYSHIRFDVGIDSLTNVSGAFGGDLDPTNGMYWTWQSGYINFKLEGLALNCPARKNRFQYHIGGYQSPYNTLREINLPLVEKQDVEIKINIDHIFKQVDISKAYQIMSPNTSAVEFANLFPSLFSIQ